MAEPEQQPAQEREKDPTEASNDFLHSLAKKFDRFFVEPMNSKPVNSLALAVSTIATGVSMIDGSVEKSIFLGIVTAAQAVRTLHAYKGANPKGDR